MLGCNAERQFLNHNFQLRTTALTLVTLLFVAFLTNRSTVPFDLNEETRFRRRNVELDETFVATKSQPLSGALQDTIQQDVAKAMRTSLASFRNTIQSAVKNAVEGAVEEAVTDFKAAASLGAANSKLYRSELDGIADRTASHLDHQIGKFVSEATAPIMKLPSVNTRQNDKPAWVEKAENILKGGEQDDDTPPKSGRPSKHSIWVSRDVQVLRKATQPHKSFIPLQKAGDAKAESDLKVLKQANAHSEITGHPVGNNRNYLAEEDLKKLKKTALQRAKANSVKALQKPKQSNTETRSERLRDVEAKEDMRLLNKGILPITKGGEMVKAVKVVRVKKISALRRLQKAQLEEARAAAKRTEEAQRDLRRLEKKWRVRRAHELSLEHAAAHRRESEDEKAQQYLKELRSAIQPARTHTPPPPPTMNALADADLAALRSHKLPNDQPLTGPPTLQKTTAPSTRGPGTPTTKAAAPSHPPPGLWGRSLEP